MKAEYKDRIHVIFTVTVILLILAGGLVKAAPRYRKYQMLKAQDAERDAMIHETERKTADLMDAINNFGTTDESVELAARAEHLYHPNETIFVFEPADVKRL